MFKKNKNRKQFEMFGIADSRLCYNIDMTNEGAAKLKYPYEINLLIDKVSEKELAINFNSIGIETLEDYLRLINNLDTMFYEQKLTFKETNEYFLDPTNEDYRIIVLSVMNKKKENSKEPNSSIISVNMSPAYKPTKELIDFLKHKQK